MAIIRDSAVVLKRLDYSETCQVIVFFTREHGKVRAIGKGVKRSTKTRFAVGIDLLEVGALVASSRQERSGTLANVIEWKQMRSLSGLREKLFRTYGALYAAEITGNLTEDWDPHPALFEALMTVLAELAAASEPLGAVVRYQLALLRLVGSLPRFDTCVLCGRPSDLTHFCSLEGGMVCRHCEPGQVEKREISGATLQQLRCANPSGARTGPFDLLNYHIAHLMGREPLLAAKLIPRVRRRTVE